MDGGGPGAATFLVTGESRANLPFNGGTLVPDVDFVLGPLVTSPLGELSFSGTWFGGLGGTTLYHQAWIQDVTGPAGWAAPNGLAGTSP